MAKVNTDFFDQLASSTTILTPNRRLAATLHKQYHQYQISKGAISWETPDILPLTTWLGRSYSNVSSKKIAAQPLLLSSTQEDFLWENILHQAKESKYLLQLSETLDKVKSAYQLLKQWQIDLDHVLFQQSEDSRALKEWLHSFKSKCKENHWIDAISLPDQLIKENFTPSLQLFLIGFIELSPQMKHFFKYCQSQGSHIHLIAAGNEKASLHRLTLTDQEDEILTMARWAKSIREEQQDARIACVFPKLTQMRERVAQVFSEVFLEEKSYLMDLETQPFNISAGKPLADFPMIAAALQILSLDEKPISNETINALLASPFMGEAESERMKRATFEVHLRKYNINRINLFELISKTTSSPIALEKNCPQLFNRLKNFYAKKPDKHSPLSYPAWSRVFNELLNEMGWPGERSLNSQEFQIVEEWLTVLNEFETLNLLSATVSRHEALEQLKRLCRKRTFQAKSPESQLQILGLLEAASLPFDYIWIAGMDDLSWPPPPEPNPFIPKRLQREFGMPHAGAERELKFSQLIMEQFQSATEHLIISHVQQNDDIELQPSPLILDFPMINVSQLPLASYVSLAKRVYHSQAIQVMSDEIAPALTTDKVRGGINVIKYQALCPFKSFAEWRLHTKELEKTTLGLKSKDRGTIIHQAMEALWFELKDQTTLLNTDNNELKNMIDRAIKKSLAPYTFIAETFPVYFSLETKRLGQLLFNWLEIEKNRSYFKVVSQEKEEIIQLNSLSLSIKIDRIDELTDGSKLIIDYKTGANNDINTWLSDRPEEPQLPLYALLDPTRTVGISFVELYPGKYAFKGLSRDDLNLKGIKPIFEVKKIEHGSWETQLANWKQILNQLGDDFYQGYAHINPKDKQKTCLNCHLSSFCRINEERRES